MRGKREKEKERKNVACSGCSSPLNRWNKPKKLG
jgi:hypothetical protein